MNTLLQTSISFLLASAPVLASGPGAPTGSDFETRLAVELAIASFSTVPGGFAMPAPVVPPNLSAPWMLSACEETALTIRQAGLVGARAEFLAEVGKCIGRGDPLIRCLPELFRDYRDARSLVEAQYCARLDVCNLLGEDEYSPDLDPRDFTADVTNRYFPLVVGRRLVYRTTGGDEVERTVTQALDETYTIQGIECRVIRDLVKIDGDPLEDTLDWYAQAPNGDVWYLGEIALNYEDEQIHDVDGSWKWGDDGALPGILMKGRPQVGDVYRQEFQLGEAEDLGMVVETGLTITTPAGTFTDCIRTADWTPIEPGISESKYYAPGVGFVLGVHDQTGERVELVRIVDPR